MVVCSHVVLCNVFHRRDDGMLPGLDGGVSHDVFVWLSNSYGDGWGDVMMVRWLDVCMWMMIGGGDACVLGLGRGGTFGLNVVEFTLEALGTAISI